MSRDGAAKARASTKYLTVCPNDGLPLTDDGLGRLICEEYEFGCYACVTNAIGAALGAATREGAK